MIGSVGSVESISSSPLRSHEKVTEMSTSQVRVIVSPNATVRTAVLSRAEFPSTVYVSWLMVGAAREIRWIIFLFAFTMYNMATQNCLEIQWLLYFTGLGAICFINCTGRVSLALLSYYYYMVVSSPGKDRKMATFVHLLLGYHFSTHFLTQIVLPPPLYMYIVHVHVLLPH